MRCAECEYSCYTECESNDMSCAIFGDDIPDGCERKDGEGCIYNGKQLEKKWKQYLNAFEHECASFVEWYEKEYAGKEGETNDTSGEDNSQDIS